MTQDGQFILGKPHGSFLHSTAKQGSVAGNIGHSTGMNGLIFIGTTNNGLAAVDYSSGKRRWQYKCKAIFVSPAMGSEGELFFTRETNLSRLTKRMVRRYGRKYRGARSITVGKQDTLFVQFADKLTNRDTKTGDEKWFIEKIEGTPILCSDDCYLSVPKRQTKRVFH